MTEAQQLMETADLALPHDFPYTDWLTLCRHQLAALVAAASGRPAAARAELTALGDGPDARLGAVRWWAGSARVHTLMAEGHRAEALVTARREVAEAHRAGQHGWEVIIVQTLADLGAVDEAAALGLGLEALLTGRWPRLRLCQIQALGERDGVPDLPASLTTAWQGVKERVEVTGLPHEMASKPSRLEVSGWSVLWRAELKTVPLGALCSVAPVRWTWTLGERRTGRAGTISTPHVRVPVANDRLPLEGRDSRCGAARLDPHTVCRSLVDLHWFGAQVCESAPAPDGAALADLMHRAGLVRMSLSEAAALVDSVGGLTAARLLTRDRGGSLASDRTWAATVADAVTSGRPILSAHQVPGSSTPRVRRPGHRAAASCDDALG